MCMCYEFVGCLRDQPAEWDEGLHGDAFRKLQDLGEGIIKEFTDSPEVARDLAAWGYIQSREEAAGSYGNIRQVYFILTPSQQAKSVGLKSLTQVSQITGTSLNTLTNWHRNKPNLFRVVLSGCLSEINATNQPNHCK